MSKTTTTYRPEQANATYKVNGKTKATTKKVGDTVYGNYNMNDYEKTVYDYTQKALAQILPQINTFSPDVMNGIQSQLNSYQHQGEKTINDIYTPMLNELKNDIASRFGNIDNSMFLDKLGSIENSRANAITQLAESLLAKRNELINNELSNRYNLVNLLNSIQNQYNSGAMNTLSAVLSLANSVKGYNQQTSNTTNTDISNILSLATALL